MAWEHLNVGSISSFTFSSILSSLSLLLARLWGPRGDTDAWCNLGAYVLHRYVGSVLVSWLRTGISKEGLCVMGR